MFIQTATRRMLPIAIFTLFSLPQRAMAAANTSSVDMTPQEVTIFDDRPDDCPPCFNCNVPGFNCYQLAPCNKDTGRCECPPGFGGYDCLTTLCGSLSDGKNRPPRPDKKKKPHCDCNKGWDGINCNVCTKDDACDSLMPQKRDGACYKGGLLQRQNFQQCDVTNQKILDQPGFGKPEVTFSCRAESKTCNFQFWVDEVESFFCGLSECSWSLKTEAKQNVTTYDCKKMSCGCIEDRNLCGGGGMVDLTEFLNTKISGPAFFETISTKDGKETSKFSEDNMNTMIQWAFGDPQINLKCHSGECLHKTQLPTYKNPVDKVSRPVIAGIVAGCALFVVVCILLFWVLFRRASRRRYGPIHLSEDDEDEVNKMLADHKPASLNFEDVSYTLNGKQILSGVQGRVKPGEILAIMGASGAGKTTLLDLLARKNKRGVCGGNFYVNGERIYDDDFRNIVGFVDQDDTMLPTLTVHETILDSALLRLPKDMSRAAKEQKVEDVERQLGIYGIRDQMIGSEEGSGRGISGGEKRRVGIACELVTSPSILFLDEPTSGLDAFNAYNVVECLVNLVKTYNRTVVFSVHQPRSNIVALFDQLILLAKGRTVYSGPFSSCQSYFDSIGYTCPPGFNIADYLVDLMVHAGITRSPMDDIIEAEGPSQTRSSSAMAIKSMASVSNLSNTQSIQGSPGADSQLRPIAIRRASVKQQQEQSLYGRKKTPTASTGGAETPTTTRSDDESPLAADDSRESTQAWFKLSRQAGARHRPQSLDDSHQLPPDINHEPTDLDHIIDSYACSEIAAAVHEDIRNAIAAAESSAGRNLNGEAHPNGDSTPTRLKGYRKVGIFGQFLILSRRTWRNLYRNPMLMLMHYAISIFLAVLLGFLFHSLTNDIGGVQNRLGLLFFVLALFGFSTLTSLTVFSTERLIFVRERAKGYYAPVSYFAAKVLFDIVPLRLIPPFILAVIVYPMAGLLPEWDRFFTFVGFLLLFNLAASAVCLFIGVIFKNGGLANLIGSLVMLFSLLFAGLLLNHKKIPKAVVWLQSLSIFHYAFEGMMVNEVVPLTLIEHKYGIDIDVPGAAILSSFGFDTQALPGDAVGLAVFCAVFIVLGFATMHVVLVERR